MYASLEGIFNYSGRLEMMHQMMLQGSLIEYRMRQEMAKDFTSEVVKVMEMDLVLTTIEGAENKIIGAEVVDNYAGIPI